LEHQKNSRPTKPKSKPDKEVWANKRQLIFWISYFVVLLVASYIFYRRFPNNYQEPNFYAEDGYVFAKNIISNGTLRALGTTFNGYYVWGIYILERFGFVVNRLFFGNQFANLARSFSLISYLFLGFITTLPILLFRNYLKPTAIVFIVLLAVFVPMTSYDYAIIGTIGNLKFAFIYLAFILLVYRHLMPENSKKVYLVDAGLLICAYTNITVYPMMLFALLRYLPRIKGKDFYKKLLADRTFQSLIVLGILMLPQLYIVKTHGVPLLKGYLDSGFIFRRTVEIFVDRSYLYGLLFPINKFLNDTIVIIVTALLVGLGLVFAKKYRSIFVFGLASVLLATLLFVVKRTGVSAFYTGYKNGGPDQFFYPQNWIFDFVMCIVGVEILSKIKQLPWRVFLYGLAFIVIIFALAPKASSYGKTDFMAENVGTIYAVGHQDCLTKASQFDLTIYPTTSSHYSGVTRQQLCTAAVTSYYPQTVSLGLLPANNDYLAGLGTTNRFSQTFVSPQNNLNGIDVYFSTFLRTVHSPYTLTLFASNCQTKLSSTAIATSKISDNTFFLIKFPAIPDSLHKTYCFNVGSSGTGPSDPLAVQLSQANQYLAGTTTINNKPSAKDIVFALHYK